VKKTRLYISLGVLAALILAFLFFPLPYHVFCPLVLEPRDADEVYVGQKGGELASLNVKAGQQVQCNMPLAELTNADLDFEIEQLHTRYNEAIQRKRSLEGQMYQDAKAGEDLPALNKQIEAYGNELAKMKLEQASLHLVAHRAGVVIPPPSESHPASPDGKLPSWGGSPLDEHNLGAVLAPGRLFCRIGDPDKFEALLMVDQADIDQVHDGQKVKLMLDAIPGTTLYTEITEKSDDPIKFLPKPLSNKSGGPIETKSDESGMPRPATIYYQARAPLNDNDRMLETGFKGQAKIDAPWHSLGWRLWRFLQRTFHFKL
jgi:putative peptide zinc metalloprotease protein